MNLARSKFTITIDMADVLERNPRNADGMKLKVDLRLDVISRTKRGNGHVDRHKRM